MTKKIAYLLIVFIIFNACSKPKDNQAYLRTVLNNLEKVESATYFSTREEFAPGDTAASAHMNHFVKEHDNPPDTTIGASDNTVALKDLKSKVVMIQFTSVSCGPCRASIPFLNELTGAYKKDDFDFIAIECTSKSLNALTNYQNKNAINYKFLSSAKTVLEEYKIRSFPVFFFLDKDFIVREVINGYGTGTTDTEIKDIIDKMIH
jgi:thiol-disulfide isomerase/thioredoxin